MLATISVLAGMAIMLGCVALWTRFFTFRAQSPQHYAGQAPVFDIRKHLNGAIICEGVIFGPTGRVTSRFVADFVASWHGNTGTMTEEFRYDSGNVQHRKWTLTLSEDGKIRAEAADLIGKGHGRQTGNAVQLNYRIKLSEDAGGHVLDAVDWMYLTPNGSIINRSQFRKYGIKVAELVATMRPADAGQKGK